MLRMHSSQSKYFLPPFHIRLFSVGILAGEFGARGVAYPVLFLYNRVFVDQMLSSDQPLNLSLSDRFMPNPALSQNYLLGTTDKRLSDYENGEKVFFAKFKIEIDS